ncbi:EamA/RhaT family transporter [Neobacillus sp. M.A.Huq-85]
MDNFLIKKNGIYVGIGLMILASLCTSFGQLFWKLSNAAFNFNLLIGFLLYFLGAVLMIFAFRFGKLSILHPLLSVGYVVSTILGAIFLNEDISIGSILGILFIMAGVVVIGGESN